MTFTHYWAILVKQWKIIVICFVVVGLATFIVSKLIRPVYQSSALVQVTVHSVNSQSDINSLLASDQLVQTESLLAISNPVLNEVTSHYKDLTADQLSKEVTTTVKSNTQLFEIDVQNNSPKQAAILANDIAATLIKQQLQATQQDNNRSQQQIQQNLDTTHQQINNITTQIANLQNQGGKQSQIAALQVELNGLQQHYAQWQTALAQLALTEAQNNDILRIVQFAQPSASPIRPQVFLYTAIGLITGLVLGMALAVLFEQLDTRVRTLEVLTDVLDWPILARIRRIKASDKEDIINPMGHSANGESYRILRTNIGFSNIDKPLRSLAVISAFPSEGKSTIATNLAIFMAKAGKNTLLVDADLRRPTIHEKFGLSAERMGLSNAILTFSQSSSLLNTAEFSIEPYMYSVNIPNLRVIPSGPLPPNPSELLDSKAMERLLLVLNHCGAEIIIFDTAPILGLSDTSILVSKIDGTLVVVDLTLAQKGKLKQMKAVLAQAGTHVLGCVVNKQKHKREDDAYSYYYYRPEVQRGNEVNHITKNEKIPVVPSTPPILSTHLNQQHFNSME